MGSFFFEDLFSLTLNSLIFFSNILPTAIDLAVPKKKRSVRRNRVRRYCFVIIHMYIFISDY